jgi:hypothetical protein
MNKETLYGNLVRPYIESPEFLALPGLILSILFIHWLTSKRNIKHSLLEARIKAYRKFVAEYSIFFSGPSFARMDAETTRLKDYISKATPNLEKSDINFSKEQSEELSKLKEKHEEICDFFSKTETRILIHKEANHVTKLFGECRLVAGEMLESKLRDMYANIPTELHSGSVESLNEKYSILGFEIEQYMRYDLGAISYLSLLTWRATFVWMRFKSKFHSARDTTETQ